MFKKKPEMKMQIQSCQCGGINLCFGNISVHLKKEEFLYATEKMTKAKEYLLSTQNPVRHEAHHEVH